MAPTPPNFGRSSFLVKKKTTKLIIKDVFLIKYWEVGVWGGVAFKILFHSSNTGRYNSISNVYNLLIR